MRATLIGDITAQASRAADSTGVEDSEMGLYVKKVTNKFEHAGPHGLAPSRPVDVVIHEYGGSPCCRRGRRPTTAGSQMRTQLMDNVVEAFGS